MGETEHATPLVERIKRHFPENWSVTTDGVEIHVCDGETPTVWEAWIAIEDRDEHEIVRLTFLAMHTDLKCIPNEENQ